MRKMIATSLRLICFDSTNCMSSNTICVVLNVAPSSSTGVLCMLLVPPWMAANPSARFCPPEPARVFDHPVELRAPLVEAALELVAGDRRPQRIRHM